MGFINISYSFRKKSITNKLKYIKQNEYCDHLILAKSLCMNLYHSETAYDLDPVVLNDEVQVRRAS